MINLASEKQLVCDRVIKRKKKKNDDPLEGLLRDYSKYRNLFTKIRYFYNTATFSEISFYRYRSSVSRKTKRRRKKSFVLWEKLSFFFSLSRLNDQGGQRSEKEGSDEKRRRQEKRYNNSSSPRHIPDLSSKSSTSLRHVYFYPTIYIPYISVYHAPISLSLAHHYRY